MSLERKKKLQGNRWKTLLLLNRSYMALQRESVRVSGSYTSPIVSLLDERFSLLTSYHCFHILSSQRADSCGPPPLYFFLYKNHKLSVYLYDRHLALITEMGAQAWIIRITGGLIERTGFIARLIIANSPFTRITAARGLACRLSLHYKRLSPLLPL